MSTLTQLLDLLEADLRDATNTEWTVAELTAHLRRSMEDVTARRPRRLAATIDTVALQYEYSLAPLSPQPLTILNVHYPYDPAFPHQLYLATWSLPVDGVLHIAGLPPTADGTDDIRLHYTAPHAISGLDAAATTTLDARGERLVLLGASAYAVQQLAFALVGTITVDKATAHYAEWARGRLAQYESELTRYAATPPAVTDARVTWAGKI